MRFEVLGKPQGKQRARVTTRGGYAMAYTPEKTATYENLICLTYMSVKGSGQSPLWDVPLVVNITAYYEIPKSFSKKRHGEALSGSLLPRVKPDMDNVVKVVCDALNGVAYRDDAQVVEIHARKLYGDTPKLVIEIEEFSGVGR